MKEGGRESRMCKRESKNSKKKKKKKKKSGSGSEGGRASIAGKSVQTRQTE